MAGPSLTAQIWIDLRTFDSSRWQAPAMGQRELGRFAGAAVIITGGAHGIGRACAARLAEEGAHIVVADLDQTAAQQVASGLAPKDRSHVPVWLDVTDASSVERAFAEAISGLGGIDVLINVAGGDTNHGTFEETADEVWVSMIELNLLGVVRCCRAAIPYLRRSDKNPAIVNVSSVNALAALGSEPYSSAKAGIGALTINLAASLAADGIRVNTVAPATIRTRNWEGQQGGADRFRHLYPLGRVGEPEDVAAAVAFLASTDAAWITGHTLPVDGGLLTGARPEFQDGPL
ncbi:MAG: short-chain dehydrogenase/reductase [Propionibacteriaceae bacterium]|nr:short-chain dehydrogenase/reductase [Propionibacteriaceae bacterium]